MDSIQGGKMTNFEKYKDEITQLTNEHKRIAFVNGKVVSCSDIDGCTICKFDNPKDSCHFLIIKWLCEEYEESIKLTPKEKAFLSIVEKGWIARDQGGDLYWYLNKPKRLSIDFEVGDSKGFFISSYLNLFNYVKWEDEPYSVEEMLTWEVENDKF